jgi:hypothetical protein
MCILQKNSEFDMNNIPLLELDHVIKLGVNNTMKYD